MSFQKTLCAALLSSAAMAMTPASALAQDNMQNNDSRAEKKQKQSKMQHKEWSQSDAQKWREMRQNAVKASEILRGSVTNGLNSVAQVQNLVLSEDGSEVEYIVYNANSPIWNVHLGDGYTSYNTVDLETSSLAGGIDVRIGTSGQVKGPEDIRITQDEADKRLVSRIMNEQIQLQSGMYEIEDILIQPETGKVTHYIIGSDPDAVFSNGKRTVRADRVSFRNGEYRSDLSMQEIDRDQPYDESWL